jgi:hypothetical protein
MRIYMAGVYTGLGRVNSGSTTIHLQVSKKYVYPWVLESFHYADEAVMNSIRSYKQTIFLDSGAFSMFTQGVKVDLKQYANFIKRHRDAIHIASNLDVIGAGHERESYDRQKQLEEYLGDLKPIMCPVHHVRDHDDWLKRYMDEGYEYIFLGGMVPESTPVLMEWLDRVWGRYLTNPDGTPRIKVHGFGLTTEVLMFKYPWFSVDSTSWIMSSRFGGLMMDFPNDPRPDGSVKIMKVDFSERSNKKYAMDSTHFLSLKPDEQEVIRARLAELEAERIRDPEVEAMFKQELGCEMGFTPEALGKSYGLRDVGNMEYFKRAMNRRVDKYIEVQPTLF